MRCSVDHPRVRARPTPLRRMWTNSAGTPSQKIENMGVALNLNEFQLINMRIYTIPVIAITPVGSSIPRVECIVVGSFLYPSGTPHRQF